MNKQNNIIIPAVAVEQGRFQPGEDIAVHIGENTLVVLPEKLTALQAANAIALLADVGSELVAIVKDACGSCEDQIKEGGCPAGGFDDPDNCPLKDVTGPEVILSDALRKDAGIPQNVKLEFFVDEGEVLVAAADYEHDITDVPPVAREVLALAGVCPGSLDQLIMSEEIIHEA